MLRLRAAFRILVFAALALPAAGREETPNFLFILSDDQGWSQVSFEMQPGWPASQSEYLETPQLARLAREGMRFTSGYAPAPLCTPTRRSILCGTSAARSGTEFASSFVPAEHLTLPRALKQANPSYRCAHFGKWGSKMGSSPEECGYDASDGETTNWTGRMEDKLEGHFVEEDPKQTDAVTGRAVEFMREQVEAERPFYVQVSYYAVHLRVEAEKSVLQRFREKGEPDRGYSEAFAAMLKDMDEGVGRLFQGLDELGIAQNTYVVFMSDNGGRGVIPGGDASRLPTNHPLSGAKQSLQEGGIRVPFLARGPGVKAGAQSSVPVSGYDLLPTFYELAGGREPLPGTVDGGSFRSLLADPQGGSVDRALPGLVFHRPRPQRGQSVFRSGPFKLLAQLDDQGRFSRTQLFDVVKDPAESADLSSQLPDKTAELRAILSDYLAEVEGP